MILPLYRLFLQKKFFENIPISKSGIPDLILIIYPEIIMMHDPLANKMRVDNHIHIRHIMLYHFEKGWKAAQSFRNLNELFGEGTISQSQVESSNRATQT
jgi:hypothetical protein